MKVLSVSSEVFPLIKTGGLADVAGALPIALKSSGVEMKTLLPGYPAVMKAIRDPVVRFAFDDLLGEPADAAAHVRPGVLHQCRLDRVAVVRPQRGREQHVRDADEGQRAGHEDAGVPERQPQTERAAQGVRPP